MVRKGVILTGIVGFSLTASGGKGMAGTVLRQGSSLAAARGFIASVGEDTSLDSDDATIGTFVPDRPGQYRDKMAKGEEFMRAGKFLAAYEQFKVASDVVGRLPEPYLNMAHARFGVGGYGMTAFYIRRALVFMPQLPTVPLRPEKFFGKNIAVYRDLVSRLDTQLAENPENGDLLLSLAYFRWFSDRDVDRKMVRSLLERALKVARSEARSEPIEIFWRAIVKSGYASGELKPVSATTKPADDSSGSTPAAKPADAVKTTP